MSKEITITGKLAREYILKYPIASKKSLARMLYRDFPEVFMSVEHARYRVRYHTGSCGVKNRKYAEPIQHPGKP